MEELGWNQKAKLWIKVGFMQGLTDLDKIFKTIGDLEAQEVALKDALYIAQDLKAGLTAVYQNMIEAEPKQ